MGRFTEARIKNIRWAIENKQTDDALMIDMLEEITRLQSRVQELEAQIEHVEGKKQTVFEQLTNTIERRDKRIAEL